MRTQTVACGSLALGGLVLMGMGVYFAFLRPPLLPEDTRYIGVSMAQIRSDMPGLQPWIGRVFGVLGGYMFATGMLTAYVAVTGFRSGRPGAPAIVAFSGLASIGVMAISNFFLHSNFRWLLLACTLPWVVALVLSWVSERRSSRRP